MEFSFRIDRVERIKEYNGMKEIIHAISWTYVGILNTNERKSLRILMGVTHLDLPTSDNFVELSTVDYFVLRWWLETVLDFPAMEDRLRFLMTVEPSVQGVHMIQGLDKINQG